MSSYLAKYSFVATYLIFGLIVMSSVFPLTEQYQSFPSDKDFSMIGQVKTALEINSNLFATREVNKNNQVFASSETASSLLTNISNSNLSSLWDSTSKIPSRSNSIEYNARILCGTIVGEEGPLRPGHYNSDINIFNRQNFPVSFFWKTVLTSDLQDEKQKQKNKIAILYSWL